MNQSSLKPKEKLLKTESWKKKEKKETKNYGWAK